jgi:Tol biopolymer transport system component/C-terminal processing protease CtpA/Prc
MYRYLHLIALLLAGATATAAPLWLRYPAISPDGTRIAFAYKGDVYTVPAAGGEAKQITTHASHDFHPVWSPDGKLIAFAGYRFGSFDIFVAPAEGGVARRLTTFSGDETPYTFTPDGKFVVFGAKIQAPAASAAFPSRVMSELYRVPVEGGRPQQLLATPAENVSFAPDGNRFVFQDVKGGENKWRKHHRSSVTRDLLLCDLRAQRTTTLQGEAGDELEPVLSSDGKTVYFLKGDVLNLHSFSLDNPAQVTPLTTFADHPVRFLSVANNGTLCFGYDGEIYTMSTAHDKPKKLAVRLTDDRAPATEFLRNKDINAYAVSPDGKQVATVMRGEIFVSGTDHKYTKRITHSAACDAAPAFAPDGRSLAYASERSGAWDIYVATLARAEEKYFFNATTLTEKPLLASPAAPAVERMLPSYSPDGKELAFVENRTRLMVYTFATGKLRQITDGSGNPIPTGNIDYEWSPDGKWFALAYLDNTHDPYTDIGLVSAQGGTDVVNLTQTGYTDAAPRWAMGGNAIIFRSERYGMRNHASWGSLNDVMAVFVNQAAYDRFCLSDDDHKLLKEGEKKSADTAGTKAVEVELRNIESRVLRLTPSSADLGDAVLSPDGDKLYYQSTIEKEADLWSISTRTKETKLELKAVGKAPLVLSRDGKTLFLLGKTPTKITLDGGKKETIAVQAQADIDLDAERRYMFRHVLLQEQKRFYTTTMHGVNWKKLGEVYAKFLPYIDNNFDFAELLSELLGELNVSHTGGRYAPRPDNPDATAALGLLVSWSHAGSGLLVDEVLEKGPFDNASSQLKSGCVIEAINGETIAVGQDYFPLLNRLAGKNTLVSAYNPATKTRWDEVVKPISQTEQTDLLYRRWVKLRQEEVERLSGGRLGYVHVRSMGDPSFRAIYADILGKLNHKEGIVIDTRYNGGGRLHEDLEVLFSGQKYFTRMLRGVAVGDMPSRRWNKPSVMLVGEANYSNAHGSPWVYRHRGLGKLVGMPVPGTMTTVSWEVLQDPTLIFGIPTTGYMLDDGSFLENQQLEPDVKQANDPWRLAAGEDQQLAKAVEVLIKDLKI